MPDNAAKKIWKCGGKSGCKRAKAIANMIVCIEGIRQ